MQITRGKILVVANVSWNLYNFRRNVIKALSDDNWEVVLAAYPDAYLDPLLHEFNVEFVPLNKLKRTSRNPISDLSFLAELWQVYRSVKPDCIIQYTIKPNIYGSLIAGMMNIPYFCVVTGLGFAFLHNGWLESMTSVLYKIAFKKCEKVIFENEDDLELFVKKQIIGKDQGLSIKGCGVDVAYFKGRQKTIHKEKFIFAYLGRLLYDKGLHELIQAFKSVREQDKSIELWLVGHLDRENPACISENDFASWLELDGVFFKGYTDDVRPFIFASDCIVYPSYREGMPRLVLEAMAMERPVITTNVPGCRETIISEKHGFLVPPRDISALQAAMAKVKQLDHIDRAIMGESARLHAEKYFSDTLIGRQIAEIITSSQDVKSIPFGRKVKV